MLYHGFHVSFEEDEICKKSDSNVKWFSSVEIQEEDKEWQEAKRVVDSLAVTLKDLKAGSRYKFRVRAENVHGMSAPSVVSEEVMIEFPDTEGEESCFYSGLDS